MEEGKLKPTVKGTPQGGVISLTGAQIQDYLAACATLSRLMGSQEFSCTNRCARFQAAAAAFGVAADSHFGPSPALHGKASSPKRHP